MSEHAIITPKPKRTTYLVTGGVIIVLICAYLWPDHTINTATFVVQGLLSVAPIVIPGILLAAWIIASGADSRIAGAFEGKTLHTVFAASLIGAVTPVCGVTVLPMMAGLLAAGVPLAPIMAFWLSSPITDPAMLATTAATLGITFAIGKTLAAFGLGLFGGLITALFAKKSWAISSLREGGFTKQICANQCNKSEGFDPFFWRTAQRRQTFFNQAWATAQLILLCLMPAFAAEYALNSALTTNSLVTYVGEGQWWAIPAAVLVGAPAYIDGYAALPLTRGLIESGMSEGAAMAFLISGGVVSIWGAMAIVPVLRLKPFLLYLVLAIVGSMAGGYIFEWAL